MRIVHFGAGNIGRGAIPEIFYGLYDELVFVDPNPVIIQQLNAQTSYRIINDKQLLIKNYRGLQSGDKSSILKALSQADVISTSCGINNLGAVADLLNELPPLNTKPYVIAFENNVRPSSHLKQLVKEADKFVFLDCTIDRIVPKQGANDSPLDVNTEAYLAVVIEQQPNMHNLEWFKHMQVVEDLEKHISLKLYGVNGLHFIIAVLGHAQNLNYVHEVFSHQACMELINTYLSVLEKFLIGTFHFETDYIKIYLRKNLGRFANADLKDECVRIARNILLKLAPDNRVTPVISYCFNNPQCDPKNKEALVTILKTLGSYTNANDPDAVKLQSMVEADGLVVTINKLTGLKITD